MHCMSGKAAIIAVVAAAGIRQSLQALEIPTRLFNHNLHGESAMRRTSSVHGIVKRCIWVRLQVNVLWAASKIRVGTSWISEPTLMVEEG